jgi:hypothetical protein
MPSGITGCAGSELERCKIPAALSFALRTTTTVTRSTRDACSMFSAQLFDDDESHLSAYHVVHTMAQIHPSIPFRTLWCQSFCHVSDVLRHPLILLAPLFAVLFLCVSFFPTLTFPFLYTLRYRPHIPLSYLQILPNLPFEMHIRTMRIRNKKDCM